MIYTKRSRDRDGLELLALALDKYLTTFCNAPDLPSVERADVPGSWWELVVWWYDVPVVQKAGAFVEGWCARGLWDSAQPRLSDHRR